MDCKSNEQELRFTCAGMERTFQPSPVFLFYPLGMKILILKIFYFQHLQNDDAYTVLDNNVAI